MNEDLVAVRRLRIEISAEAIEASVLMSAPSRLADRRSVVKFKIDPVEPTVREAYGVDHLQAMENAILLVSSLLEAYNCKLVHMEG